MRILCEYGEDKMKQLTCVILGYGDRSERYSAYALSHPEELQVIAVIDIGRIELSETVRADIFIS